MSRKVIDVNFGSRSRRNKRKILNYLKNLIDHIENDRLEYSPHGYLLVLMSEENPDRYEILNCGITRFEMADCRLAIIKRVHELSSNYK